MERLEGVKGIKFVLYFAGTIIFVLYAGLNYYVGLRSWQTLFSYVPMLPGMVYWVGFWFVAMAYLVSRVGEGILPAGINRVLSLIGSYWLGIMFYALLSFFVVDLIRGLDHVLHFLPGILKNGPWSGWIVFLVVAGIVLYGAWNARHPVVNHYDLSVQKKAGNLQQLHIVMVSDIHLGTIMDDGRLAQMVASVNAQAPDLILFAGDMIDENVERVIRQEMRINLSRLKAPYGVYAVLGNHEYLGGHVREAMSYLGESGVHILRDTSAKVAHSFYIVGRDDLSGRYFMGKQRRSLKDLLAGFDPSLPVIVLDHQPSRLEEPEQAEVDLQLSGHTHRGQLFPIQIITHRIFADDFGFLQKGNFHLIVSSGFGTWGPPLRVGNKPEIVDITVRFAF